MIASIQVKRVMFGIGFMSIVRDSSLMIRLSPLSVFAMIWMVMEATRSAMVRAAVTTSGQCARSV